MSLSGYPCHVWRPNGLHRDQLAYLLGDPERHNACRNPDKDPLGPWCRISRTNESSSEISNEFQEDTFKVYCFEACESQKTGK